MESVNWVAQPATILLALMTEREAKFPRSKSGKMDGKKEWQENHEACLQKLTDLLLDQRVG